MKTGIQLIDEERQRQILQEGWTTDHDDEHTSGELSMAAMCYSAYAGNMIHPDTQGDGDWDITPPEWWPWEASWWKPNLDPMRNLAKAGALIVAEIERIQRANVSINLKS